jgi:V/A-type H+/Na+-transporting ATPase subunit E
MEKLDSVSKKVIDEAEKAKKRELEKAKKMASEIIEESKKEAIEIHRSGKLSAWNRYREKLAIELSRIKSQMNSKILMYKIGLVEDVIDEAKKRLLNMDKDDYKEFLKNSLESLNIDDGYYLIGSEEEKIDDEMVASIANLKKSGEKPGFKKGIKIIKGKAEYRISPEISIDSKIDDIRMEIAMELFGNSGEK